MWFGELQWTVVLLVLLVKATARNGCTDKVKAKCEDSIASVCRTETCPHSTVGGEQFKKAMIGAHNSYRKLAYTDGSHGADMMKVEWDEQLENAALGWAHRLCSHDRFEHDSHECRSTEHFDDLGQNLYKASGSRYGNETYVAYDAVESWYNEIHDTTAEEMFPFTLNSDTAHYTQLVWSQVYRIGCALITKKPTEKRFKVWVVCDYGPAGNMMNAGMNVFKPASKVASACRTGSAQGDSGLCELIDEQKYRDGINLHTDSKHQNKIFATAKKLHGEYTELRLPSLFPAGR